MGKRTVSQQQCGRVESEHSCLTACEARSRGAEIITAPDIFRAADVTTGSCGGTVHRRLIREARRPLQEFRESSTGVRRGWAQGRTGMIWKEIADEIANRGRGDTEGGPKEAKLDMRKKRPELVVEQRVNAGAVRQAIAEKNSAGEAIRWARHIWPRGDGTATSQTHYARKHFSGDVTRKAPAYSSGAKLYERALLVSST